jgi:hypothetical protein
MAHQGSKHLPPPIATSLVLRKPKIRFKLLSNFLFFIIHFFAFIVTIYVCQLFKKLSNVTRKLVKWISASSYLGLCLLTAPTHQLTPPLPLVFQCCCFTKQWPMLYFANVLYIILCKNNAKQDIFKCKVFHQKRKYCDHY